MNKRDVSILILTVIIFIILAYTGSAVADLERENETLIIENQILKADIEEIKMELAERKQYSDYLKNLGDRVEKGTLILEDYLKGYLKGD